MNSSSKWRAVLLGVALAACCAGCSVRKPRARLDPFVDRNYIDLEPGWRVRVVTPILKSGKFKIQADRIHPGEDKEALTVGNDFVGYEIDYYDVASTKNGKGVAVQFDSAEVMSNGKSITQPQPRVPLFDLPESVRHVRLLFLTRVSQSEHDQAILGSSSLTDLDLLRKKVESSPAENCKIQPEGICAWVPGGIAVQPEKRTNAGSRAWVPVN